MIEKKIICDRCGRECEYSRYSRGQRVFRNKFFLRKSDDDFIDLCQECYDSLAEWMKSGKSESEE